MHVWEFKFLFLKFLIFILFDHSWAKLPYDKSMNKESLLYFKFSSVFSCFLHFVSILFIDSTPVNYFLPCCIKILYLRRFCCLLFLVVLGFELRAFYHLSHTFFALGYYYCYYYYFQIGSCFLPGSALDLNT
jgi:hypothetical protein